MFKCVNALGPGRHFKENNVYQMTNTETKLNSLSSMADLCRYE